MLSIQILVQQKRHELPSNHFGSRMIWIYLSYHSLVKSDSPLTLICAICWFHVKFWRCDFFIQIRSTTSEIFIHFLRFSDVNYILSSNRRNFSVSHFDAEVELIFIMLHSFTDAIEICIILYDWWMLTDFICTETFKRA